MPGGTDQPNAGGGNQQQINRNTPMGRVLGAVEDFLTAVKDKDPAALAEAVALRAPTEAKVASHVPLLTAIRENTITDEQLDALAHAFEGYQISQVSLGKTTAQLNVQLAKVDEHNDLLLRTLYLRREKAGWKVLDFATNPYNYGNAQQVQGQMRGGTYGGGRR